jgi:hypothetical protein
MHSCKDSSARTRILNLLLGLLDSNSSNIEALMVLAILLGLYLLLIVCSVLMLEFLSGAQLELLA